MIEMDEQLASELRKPFPPELVGKLPKLTCKACSQAPGRVCEEHTKERCSTCGNWISTAHTHLDYVGHAAATDRLLTVDPEFTWEPLARDEHGLPVMITDGLLADEQVGLWINLTVAGVTRPGFGGGKNIKEAIGDAIRNAAMRFGVALDLWSKEDLHADSGGVGDQAVSGSALPWGEPEPPPNDSSPFVPPAPKEQPTDGGDPLLVVISFGKKHKGKTIGQVKAEDPGYLRWMTDPEKFQPKDTEQRREVGAATIALGMAVPVPAGDSDFNPPHDDSDVPF